MDPNINSMAPVCAMGSYSLIIGAEKENLLAMTRSTHPKFVQGERKRYPQISPDCDREANTVTVSCICSIIVAAVCVITATDTNIFRAG